MLSDFIYDKFRAFLVARAEKYGIKVIFKNPFATSVIGMVRKVKSASKPVVFSNSKIHGESPMPQNC